MFVLFNRALLWPILATSAVVTASNYLVQFPFTPFNLQDYFTWGAFTYPVAFLITDLVNRKYGLRLARTLVIVGFIVGVIASLFFGMLPVIQGASQWNAEVLAEAITQSSRIAFASGLAFLVAQLMDIKVFDLLRKNSVWWIAPFLSTFLGSMLDTACFFTLAFYGSDLPWISWAFFDYLAKLVVALFMLAPYRGLMWRFQPQFKS